MAQTTTIESPPAEHLVTPRRITERELREAVNVRIGLVGDPHLRRMLRSYFADSNRSVDYYAPGGVAERNVELARICGAAAGSLIGVDRDLVTTCALFMQTDPATTIAAVDVAYRTAGSVPDSVRLAVLRCTLKGWGVVAGPKTREGVVLFKTFKMIEHVYLIPISRS